MSYSISFYKTKMPRELNPDSKFSVQDIFNKINSNIKVSEEKQEIYYACGNLAKEMNELMIRFSKQFTIEVEKVFKQKMFFFNETDIEKAISKLENQERINIIEELLNFVPDYLKFKYDYSDLLTDDNIEEATRLKYELLMLSRVYILDKDEIFVMIES